MHDILGCKIILFYTRLIFLCIQIKYYVFTCLSIFNWGKSRRLPSDLIDNLNENLTYIDMYINLLLSYITCKMIHSEVSVSLNFVYNLITNDTVNQMGMSLSCVKQLAVLLVFSLIFILYKLEWP